MGQIGKTQGLGSENSENSLKPLPGERYTLPSFPDPVRMRGPHCAPNTSIADTEGPAGSLGVQ